MIEYLIGGFVLGIFAGMAIVNTWNYFWDTHGEKPFAALDPDHTWMRREIERVGIALFTGANGYVGTEDDLKAVGQFVEGVCETMEKDQADNLRFIKANAEVANLNADLQIENMRLREAGASVRCPTCATCFSVEWANELEALAEADLSKLTTQQKPTLEAMLRANPSCGMDGCLWERDGE